MQVGLLRRLFSPLLSLIIFATGSGLLGTLLPVIMEDAHVPVFIIGLLSSLFYAGYALGALHIERNFVRIGLIRTYTALAASVTVITLLHGLHYSTLSWLALRFVYGFCVVGLFVTIETWFLAKSGTAIRGRVLSVYMFGMYGAQALGQWLLGVGDWHKGNAHFSWVAILLALSIIPLSLTNRVTPKMKEMSKLSLRTLYRISPSGVTGGVIGGGVLGVFYGLMPTVAQQMWGTLGVASVMSAIIIGGMALQYPCGKLSDYFSRRWVLLSVSAITMLLSAALLCPMPLPLFLFFSFLFGGASFALYPLSVNYACDFVDRSETMAISSSLRFAYSIGAITSPLLGALFIYLFGASGIFLFFVLAAGALCIKILWRSSRRPTMPLHAQKRFEGASPLSNVAVDFSHHTPSGPTPTPAETPKDH